jgi:D-sedoheptulose 7-phosphate isomerase
MQDYAWIEEEIQESIAVKRALGQESVPVIAEIADRVLERLQAGNKVILFGNGGSAADAQHIAAELVGRYRAEREALPAIALTTDTSALTAIGNDYGFEEVFARQLSALGHPGDVALALSTSGNSANVMRALEVARERGLFTIGLSGRTGSGP